jgi:mitochondrial fission protein ELM1
MRVLVLRDWRPGHIRQAEGLALAAERVAPITTERIEVRPRLLAGDRVRRLSLRRWRGDPAGALRLLYGIDIASLSAPDVIMASGRPTLAAGILLRRHFGAKLVFAGFVRGYDPADLDLMLVQSPRFAGEPKCALSPIPCTIHPDSLPLPRRLTIRADLAGSRFALFLGGSARGYKYSDADWHALARLVVDASESYGVRWSVSDSRRTPAAATRSFAELAAAGSIDQFIHYGSAGPGSADVLFSADAIAVTEDSRTMMAESMAARRPVIALRPERVRFSLATEEVTSMACGGGLAVLPIRWVTADQFVGTLMALRPAQQPSLDAIAAALRDVLATGAGCRHEAARSVANPA